MYLGAIVLLMLVLPLLSVAARFREAWLLSAGMPQKR